MADDDLDPQESPAPPPGVAPDVHADVVLENALLRAGVDLDSEQGKILRQAVRGTEPDVDAIKRQWDLLKPAEKAPDLEPSEPRLAGEETQASVRQGLTASGVVEPNPGDNVKDPMTDSVKAGWNVIEPAEPYTRPGTSEDAVSTAFHIRAEAAEAGDTRVLSQE